MFTADRLVPIIHLFKVPIVAQIIAGGTRLKFETGRTGFYEPDGLWVRKATGGTGSPEH